VKVLRGRAEDVEVLVAGDESMVYGMTLRLADGEGYPLRMDVPVGREAPNPGDEMEVKVRQTAGGDDVVFCRDESKGAILVDRTKGEDSRRTWWYVGIALTFFVIAWYIIENL